MTHRSVPGIGAKQHQKVWHAIILQAATRCAIRLPEE